MLGDEDLVDLIVADIAVAVAVLILVGKQVGHLFTGLAHTLQDMSVFVSFGGLIRSLVGSPFLVILIIVPSGEQGIRGFYFVARFIGNKTANIILVAAGISRCQNGQIRSVVALALTGIAKRYICQLTAHIHSSAPGVGQHAVADRLHAEMGNVAFVVSLLGAGYANVFYILRLHDDLDLCILYIITGGTLAGCIVAVSSFACIVTGVVAISAPVPVIVAVKVPYSGRPYIMAVGGFCMTFIKMLFPFSTFHTYPFSVTVASVHTSDIFAANEAKTTVITDAFALGAVFLTVRADGSTFFTGTAVLTNLYTFAAQIAVFTKFTCTINTVLSAVFAERIGITARLTIRAVTAFLYGTVNAQLMGRANLGACGANTALRAELAATLNITIVAIGAMKAFPDSTFFADHFPQFFTARNTKFRTIITSTAFLTPAAGISVATATFGAM